MPQFDDDLMLGPVVGRQLSGIQQGSSPMNRGFGPLGRVYVWDIVPIALSATAVATAQAVVLVNTPLAINGASAVNGVAVMDYARCLRIVSTGAGDTTQTVTIVGTDISGLPQTAVMTLNGTTVVTGTKAFKTVISATVNLACAGNISVGTTDKFGLPVYLSNIGYIVSVKWNSVATQDTGVVVLGDATSPATALTTDTRGTYTLSSVADGVKRLIMVLALTGGQVGPTATAAGLNGVTPF